MKLAAFALSVSALCAPALAQNTLVMPQGYATRDNPEWGNGIPFNWFVAGGPASAHAQFLYDNEGFLAQGAPSPILITKLRFRADASQAYSWAGGTWSACLVKLATSPRDHTDPSTVFAQNLGPDVVTCVNGPITVTPGVSAGPPSVGPWCIDIPLTTPFVYDPVIGGDLTVDINIIGASWTGGTGVGMDSSILSGVSRVYTMGFSGGYLTTASGSKDLSGLLCEFTYSPLQGYASVNFVGSGCYDRASSFYETFPSGGFDLAGTAQAPNGLQLVPNSSGGWFVLPGATGWHTPTSQNLGLLDDGTVTINLPFAVNTPSGPKSAITISSNGFVWMGAGGAHGCCEGEASSLLQDAERLCALWQDLDPSLTGSIHFDYDASTQSAYVTWLAVPEWGHPASTNTFQIAFLAGGAATELRWQQCANLGHQTLVGWSQGNGARDGGPEDLSQPQPFTTEIDSTPVRLRMSPRPILGRIVTFGTLDIPAPSPFTLTLLDVQAVPTGVDLGLFGAPGCNAYTGFSAAALSFFAFVTNGTSSVNVLIPNAPAFQGLNFFAQSMSATPSANPLGVLVSNALDMVVRNQ